MAELVFVYGNSGSGKSRSLINFGEKEILLFNILAKRMPFSTKFANQVVTDSVEEIWKYLKAMPMKVAVIDDGGYILTSQFMKGHGKGDQFKLYNDIADSLWQLFLNIKYQLPEDVIVYFIMHEDVDDNGNSKLMTIGKLLDQKVCLPGLATVVFHCIVKGKEHLFLTQSNGYDIAKSPEGMFPEEIPNDLKAADTRMREYWGMNTTEKKK